jgi:serine/threonine-protein kinase
VLDVGTLANGSPFMVMEYLEGNDLSDELARRGPLPVEEVVVYVLQAIEALAEAHAAGIVHRDLKPENLFLAVRADGSRIIKVLDFGISKSIAPNSITDLSLTKTSSFVGSPLYMSPEQMRSSRSVDQRTDIWSLGAILYEAVAGKLPYFAESIAELCTKLLHEAPPPLSQVRSGLPPGFETVVLRCLEKDRERRYSTVAELARALVPFAAGAGVYADRANRVLTMAGIASRSIQDAVPSMNLSWNAASLPSAVSQPAVAAVATGQSMAERSSTPGSWVKSSAGEVSRRRAPLIGALIAILMLGVGWTFGSRARENAVTPVTMEPASTPEVAAARPAAEPRPKSPEPIVATAAPVPPPPAVSPSGAAAPPRAASEPARVRRSQVAPQPVAKSATPPQSGSAPLPSGRPATNAWDPSTFGGRH